MYDEDTDASLRVPVTLTPLQHLHAVRKALHAEWLAAQESEDAADGRSFVESYYTGKRFGIGTAIALLNDAIVALGGVRTTPFFQNGDTDD